MNGGRPGKPPKPLLKAPKGDRQLGVADFFKPSIQTASEKKATEGEAAKAHAESVAGDRAAQAEWDAAAKKREPGRPPKLASGISSKGTGPLLGRKNTKRKGVFNPSTCARTHVRTHTHISARTHVRAHTRTCARTHTHTRKYTTIYTRTHVNNARTHVHARTHTYTHTHTRTHTHVRACISVHVQLRGQKALA